MNETWELSLLLAHRWWVIPFGLLLLAAWGTLTLCLIRKQPLPPSFLLLNRLFLIAADMQWMLGVLYWVTTQQWQSPFALIAFRHPLLMTAVWFMFRYGNVKMKRRQDEADRLRDGFAYYLLGGVFTVVGLVQILGA